MECMLFAYDIPHYVHNRSFGGLYPGMQIPLYNVRRVMVPVAYAEEAMNLFGAFRDCDCYTGSFTTDKLSLRDRARVIAEIILGGWAIPFKHRKFNPDHEDLAPEIRIP